MHLFESDLLLDASVQECGQTWSDCCKTWLVSEDCLNLDSLLKTANYPGESITIQWDFAANSTENHKVLWWYRKSKWIEASGTIDFDHVSSYKTRVKLRVQLNSLAGLYVESGMPKLLGQALRQFRLLVSSHQKDFTEEVLHHAIA